MTKTFNLGKIAYYGNRKDHLVEVTIGLENKTKGPVFTASGVIWNRRKTDCYCGGQCLDTIAKYIDTELFNTIYELWTKYHLNDLHPGTPKQEAALINAGLNSWATNYRECCKYLQTLNLLVDDGYEFGSGWLYEPIPDEDLKKIKELLNA